MSVEDAMPTVATAVGSRRCRLVSVTLLALVSTGLLSSCWASTPTLSPWSGGGSQQHLITVASTTQSHVAIYDVGQTPLPPGLVGGYRFSEGAGTTTADVSGNNNTGILVNGPAWTAGEYGGALSFSGAN